MVKELGPLDVVIAFKESTAPTIYLTEEAQITVDYLLKQHGQVMVRFNWFDKNLDVIVPDKETPVITI